jgi:hypothetical protein
MGFHVIFKHCQWLLEVKTSKSQPKVVPTFDPVHKQGFPR